ncbi:MAG: hypothetical protein OEM39_01655 [Acidimicrobiia bacterium]|nr:hypothetical protein [Acidimicrobiia bacterium]
MSGTTNDRDKLASRYFERDSVQRSHGPPRLVLEDAFDVVKGDR